MKKSNESQHRKANQRMTTIQPRYHFENTFAPLSGENIVHQYECEEGCSKCCGPKTFIALTDVRLIVREQGPNQCLCCGKGPHADKAIYLRDIGVMKNSGHNRTCCGACLHACLNGTCICFLLSLCCASCCGDRPRFVTLQGGFGAELLTFKRPDAIQAVNQVSSMIHPFKSIE